MASYVYVKNPNGTTYVYQNESYWDKVEKKTRHRRKCVGKLHPETNALIPNKKQSTAVDIDKLKVGHCSVLTIGPSLLLEKAAHETGIDKVLQAFFPQDWDRILTCAYYLASEGGALCHVEQWSTCNRHPFCFKLANQRVSELLSRITPSMQKAFFKDWMALNHNKEYFALDITSVSSYSALIDYVRRGYNKDGEDLPQVNLLMLTSEKTRLPIYYRILSGSIKDVSTIHESLAEFRILGAQAVHLVMDKGFYSESNIDALYKGHYHFSVGVPFTASIAMDAVKANQAEIASHKHIISIGEDDLYAVTKRISWKGHRCYLHTYYDSLKGRTRK